MCPFPVSEFICESVFLCLEHVVSLEYPLPVTLNISLPPLTHRSLNLDKIDLINMSECSKISLATHCDPGHICLVDLTADDERQLSCWISILCSLGPDYMLEENVLKGSACRILYRVDR